MYIYTCEGNLGIRVPSLQQDVSTLYFYFYFYFSCFITHFDFFLGKDVFFYSAVLLYTAYLPRHFDQVFFRSRPCHGTRE